MNTQDKAKQVACAHIYNCSGQEISDLLGMYIIFDYQFLYLISTEREHRRLIFLL